MLVAVNGSLKMAHLSLDESFLKPKLGLLREDDLILRRDDVLNDSFNLKSVFGIASNIAFLI